MIYVSCPDLGCGAETPEAEAGGPTEIPHCCAPSGPAAGSGWLDRFPEGCCCLAQQHLQREEQKLSPRRYYDLQSRLDAMRACWSWIHLPMRKYDRTPGSHGSDFCEETCELHGFHSVFTKYQKMFPVILPDIVPHCWDWLVGYTHWLVGNTKWLVG